MTVIRKILAGNDTSSYFDDMIGLAIKYGSSGQYKDKFKYLMVAEFQDISEPRARSTSKPYETLLLTHQYYVLAIFGRLLVALPALM